MTYDMIREAAQKRTAAIREASKSEWVTFNSVEGAMAWLRLQSAPKKNAD